MSTSLLPGTSVTRLEIRPPVQLSAVASLSPRAAIIRTTVASSEDPSSEKICWGNIDIAIFRPAATAASSPISRKSTSPIRAQYPTSSPGIAASLASISCCKSLSPIPVSRSSSNPGGIDSPASAIKRGATSSRNIGYSSRGGPGSRKTAQFAVLFSRGGT